MLKRWMALLSGSALVVLASGCVVDVSDNPPIAPGRAEGLLTTLWTVDNTTDPEACAYYALDPAVGMDVELTIYDRSRGLMLTEYAACEEFELSVVLPANDYYYDGRQYYYQGEMTMVDPITLEALSTTLPLRDIWLGEDEETVIDVNFPPSSFRF